MNNLSLILNNGILQEPGDTMSARVTKSGRRVLKISKNQGDAKCSVTQYSNGTIVETRTIKQK